MELTLATLTCTSSAPVSYAFRADYVNRRRRFNAPSSVTNVSAATGGGQSNTTNDSWSDVTQIEPPVSLNVFNYGNQVPLASQLPLDYRRLLHARSRSFELCRLACRYGVQFLSPSVTGRSTRFSPSPRRRPRARLHSGHGTRPRRSMPFCCPCSVYRNPYFQGPVAQAKTKLAASPSFSLSCSWRDAEGAAAAPRRPPPPTLHGGTPRGNFTITVTAADSAASLARQPTVTLTVNWKRIVRARESRPIREKWVPHSSLFWLEWGSFAALQKQTNAKPRHLHVDEP